MITERRKKRVFPPPFGDRYYPLRQLYSELKKTAHKYISGLEGDEKVLVDFGCGEKPYEDLFSPYVSKYIGLDLPENEWSDEHITVDGLSELPDQYADIALSTQVLEHAEKPKFYLREVLRVLKRDGLLILTTHGFWKYHPHPKDLWRWTGEGLEHLLADSGFRVLETRGVMGLAPSSLLLLQDALLPKIPRLLRIFRPAFVAFFQALMVLSDKLYDEKDRKRDACIFLIIAKKDF